MHNRGCNRELMINKNIIDMRVTPEDIRKFDNSSLEELFNHKLTENGDNTHESSGNRIIDIFFQSEYFENHLNEVKIGKSDVEKILAMFIRDPRHGIGRRDLGRVLLRKAGVSAENVAKCGRFDDLWESPMSEDFNEEWLNYLFSEIKKGNNLAKKWMPHYVGKNKKSRKVAKSTLVASKLRKLLGITKQQYNKLVKVDTVEQKMSEIKFHDVDFEKLPSLALLKYWSRFRSEKEDERKDVSVEFEEYLDSVRKGEKKMHMSTTTVYDIYKNRFDIDPDLAFSQITKVRGNWIPIVDTSGSMHDDNDSYGKALAIGHYLGKTSTYCPNQVVSFSSNPRLLNLGDKPLGDGSSEYLNEINSMHTGDYTNTDFGAVMNLFKCLKDDYPEYIVVLTDMEFDMGSSYETESLLEQWHNDGVKTKMIWWNLNARNRVSAQTVKEDAFGNLYMSGYNPMLLGLLNVGFSMYDFMANMLTKYSESIGL